MPLVIPNTFVPLTTILSSATNTNNTSISNWANAHETATTGVHGVGAGTIVGTANVNAFTNNNSFGAPVTFTNGISTNSPNFISNARLTLTAGTLSLASISGGGAPSATNPVYFTYPTSDGSWQTVTFTSTTYCTIRDTTAGTDMNGMNLGTTAGVAWGDVMPLFIYLVSDGVNPCLFLSRFPVLNGGLSYATTYLGYAGVPPATNQDYNMIGCTTNNITISHASKPALLIGVVEATKSAANSWTFSTLNYSYNLGNFGRVYNTSYTFPTGQNGAGVGTYNPPIANTPTYSSQTYTYFFRKNGSVGIRVQLSNTVGGTPGAGASSLQILAPLRSDFSLGQGYKTGNSFYAVNGGTDTIGLSGDVVGDQIFFNYYQQTSLVTGITGARKVVLRLGDQSDPNIRQLTGNLEYYLF